MNDGFVTARVYPGDTNALVKNIMKQIGIDDPNEAVRRVNAGEWVLTQVAKAVEALLVVVGTVSLTATTEKLVVGEKFVVNVDNSAEVRIVWVGDDLKDWFWGIVEAPFAGGELLIQKFARASLDGPMITELGGVLKARTSFGEMFALMKKQGKGQEGKLLTNGWTTIFYIPQMVTKLEDNAFSYTKRDGTIVTEQVLNPDYLFEQDGTWYVLRTVGCG